MRRARAVTLLVIWFFLLSTVLVWLHRQGGVLAPPNPSGAGEWMTTHGPEVAVMVALRFACLAVGWYLLISTSGAVVARWLQAPGAARVVESVTPPLVRRLVSGMAGVAMTATATTVATGASPVSAYPASASAVSASAVSASAVSAPGGGAPIGPDTFAPAGGSDGEPTMRKLLEGPEDGGAIGQATEHPVEMRLLPPQVEPEPAATGLTRRTVLAGDHFWSIAESELVAARSHPVSDADIDPYWRLLVDANRAEVVDPDLLFPGQVVVVPPVPPAAGGP